MADKTIDSGKPCCVNASAVGAAFHQLPTAHGQGQYNPDGLRLIKSVLAIAVRSDHRGPMVEVNQAETFANDCLAGDHGSSTERGITLLASWQWQQVIQQLGVDFPWHTRRANLLIEADTLEHLIGRTIRIGHVRVDVKAETEPCGQMDRWQPGLKAALATGCRGGVYGQIIDSGTIQVDDKVCIEKV